MLLSCKRHPSDVLMGVFYIDRSLNGSPNLISGESVMAPRFYRYQITRSDLMQKHLSLLKDVRGCMTRFDPSTDEQEGMIA